MFIGYLSASDYFHQATKITLGSVRCATVDSTGLAFRLQLVSEKKGRVFFVQASFIYSMCVEKIVFVPAVKVPFIHHSIQKYCSSVDITRHRFRIYNGIIQIPKWTQYTVLVFYGRGARESKTAWQQRAAMLY